MLICLEGSHIAYSSLVRDKTIGQNLKKKKKKVWSQFRSLFIFRPQRLNRITGSVPATTPTKKGQREIKSRRTGKKSELVERIDPSLAPNFSIMLAARGHKCVSLSLSTRRPFHYHHSDPRQPLQSTPNEPNTAAHVFDTLLLKQEGLMA